MEDAAAYREASRERWASVAPGWAARRAELQRTAEAVSQWMVEAVAPQPGHVVLEVAAGPGDTGLMAAERVRPGGRLICTDAAEPMLGAARERAAELGVENAEFRPMEAEWLDQATASVDAVLCRWGYMLLADPEAALREGRRVLRPGGRIALAAWTAPEENPWVAQTAAELQERGLAEPPAAGTPTMFSFAAPGRIEELLHAAGFADVEVDTVDLTFAAPSFDDWWEYVFDTSTTVAGALAAASPEERDAVHEAVAARLAPWTSAEGALALPGRTWVAAASA